MNNSNDVFSAEYIGPDRGKGVRILKDFNGKTSVFTENPIFSYVHYFTRKSTLVCDNCSASIGSLLDNLNHVLKLDKRCVSNSVCEKLNELKHMFPELEGVQPVKCDMNCDFIFCSKKCLEAFNNTHMILCQLMDSQELQQWKHFERYSLKTHENFYFAGLIYINILYDSLYDKKKTKEWIDKINEFYNKRWDEMSTLDSHSTNPYDIAYNSFYMMESCLRRFREQASKQDEDVDKLFELDFYLRLLGMMDLVCVDVEIPNPLNTLLYDLKNDKNGSVLVEALSEDLERVYRITNGGTDDPVDVDKLIDSMELFPHILGLGLFNFVSKMNHSCSPNLEVEYMKDNKAKINTLRDISKGEEATISYINENLSYEKRQMLLLKNYGFKCNCGKCVLEGTKINTENLN